MDPIIITALSGTTVELMKKVLDRRAKNDIANNAKSTLNDEPDSQSRVRNIFQTSKWIGFSDKIFINLIRIYWINLIFLSGVPTMPNNSMN